MHQEVDTLSIIHWDTAVGEGSINGYVTSLGSIEAWWRHSWRLHQCQRLNCRWHHFRLHHCPWRHCRWRHCALSEPSWVCLKMGRQMKGRLATGVWGPVFGGCTIFRGAIVGNAIFWGAVFKGIIFEVGMEHGIHTFQWYIKMVWEVVSMAMSICQGVDRVDVGTI